MVVARGLLFGNGRPDLGMIELKDSTSKSKIVLWKIEFYLPAKWLDNIWRVCALSFYLCAQLLMLPRNYACSGQHKFRI